VSPQETEVLRIVAGQQPITAISIARQMCVGKGGVRRTLWGLQNAGLVEKRAASQNDVVWVLADAARPERRKLKPYERASSVWEYADRCRRMK